MVSRAREERDMVEGRLSCEEDIDEEEEDDPFRVLRDDWLTSGVTVGSSIEDQEDISRKRKERDVKMM